MKAIILAGGLGTRLRERVADLPKPMAPIAGKPFLSYLLSRISRAGFEEAILSVGYRWQAIHDYFGDTFYEDKKELPLRYIVEPEPLGTGGAILLASQGLTSPFAVFNGDTLLDFDLVDLQQRNGLNKTSLTIVLRKVDDTSRYGAVQVQHDIVVGFNEKGLSGPGYINGGIYVLPPDIFSRYNLSGKFSLENDLLQAHCTELRPYAHPVAGYFIDIGIPEDYDRAQRELPCLEK